MKNQMILARYLSIQRSRKARQDITDFDTLIASPADLEIGFVLPANAKLHVKTTAVLAVTTALITVGNRTLYGNPGAANKNHSVGWFEEGETVTLVLSAPGTVSVWIEDFFGVLVKIAEGSFAAHAGWGADWSDFWGG